MIKIIKSSKAKKQKRTTAKCRCGCKFSFSASDARFFSDQRDGDAYIVRCPECLREIWIAASRLR